MKLFRKRYMIELLVIAGFAGFMVGSVLLFARDIFKEGRESVFHEVAYDTRYIISELVKQKKKELGKDSVGTRYLDSFENTIRQTNDSVLLSRMNKNLVSHLNSFEISRLKLDTVSVGNTRSFFTTPIHWQFRDTSLKKFAM